MMAKFGATRIAFSLVMIVAGSAQAAFQSNTLVVVRIGDGTNLVNDTAQSVYLDEYSVATGALLGSHPLPASGASAFTMSGQGEHDGHLNLSSNGRFLTLGGYRADSGTANPVMQSASSVNRVIARVDGNWNMDTSTALPDAYDRCDITGVVSDNGQRFWTVGEGKYFDPINGRVDDDFKVPTISGGLRHVAAVGAQSSTNLSQTQVLPANLDTDLWPDSIRSARIVNSQLYINTPAPESFLFRGAFATSDPLPVTGPQAMIPVITNAPPSTDTSGKFVPKSDIILLDLDSTVPGVDTAYSTGGKADYQKWSLVNGSWIQLSNAALLNSSEEINAFDVLLDGSTVTLLAVTDQGIYRLDDTGGYNAPISSLFSSPIIVPDGSAEFRGITIVPEPGTALLLGLAALAWGRSRRRTR